MWLSSVKTIARQRDRMTPDRDTPAVYLPFIPDVDLLYFLTWMVSILGIVIRLLYSDSGYRAIGSQESAFLLFRLVSGSRSLLWPLLVCYYVVTCYLLLRHSTHDIPPPFREREKNARKRARKRAIESFFDIVFREFTVFCYNYLLVSNLVYNCLVLITIVFLYSSYIISSSSRRCASVLHSFWVLFRFIRHKLIPIIIAIKIMMLPNPIGYNLRSIFKYITFSFSTCLL